MDVDRNHVWEVRHAGLLGIKYLVAVRSDLFEEVIVKLEGSDLECGNEVLRGVADAAILGYGIDVGSLTLDLIHHLQVR
jgi:TATA-binding protein-associated factor